MKQLRLASALTLPVDAATQTFLNVGKRGSGKTSTGVRLVEQLLGAGVPCVVLDPADVWWGLKASKDGGRGLAVYVFGGRHQDLPLDSTSGVLLADLVVDQRVSTVLSVKHLSGRERTRLVTDFARQLFQRNTEAVHLVLEEAHELAPQNPYKGEEEMLGAMKRLWKLGRASGIGGTAITQRPAALHKDITTQAEVLIVHRTIGPQDVAAVREWIRFHGEREDILAQLSELKTGEAFVWAPDFPEGDPIGLKRVQMLPRQTFDSSATPKPGERRTEPKELQPVDLEKLRSKMAAAIERAKAEDPRELRRRIAELERELKAKPGAALAKEKRVEVPILRDAQVKRLKASIERLRQGAATLLRAHARQVDQLSQRLQVVVSEAGLLQDQIKAATGAAARDNQRGAAGRILAADGRSRAAVPHTARPAPVVPRPRGNGRAHQPPAEGLTGPQQKILDAAAFLESLGIQRPDVVQLALFAGLSASGGYWRANIGRLRTLGLVEGTSVTEAGRAAAREAEIRSVEQLHEHVFNNLLTGPQRNILHVLIDTYPEGLSADEVGKRASLEPAGGYWRANLGRLRSLGLVSKRGPLQALPVLFLEGA